jgi:hypothetical protein
MKWLEALTARVARDLGVDMIFLGEASIAPPGDAFEQDDCYVELYVNSLRLEKARKFTTKFHGVVYTYPSLAYQGNTTVTLPAISKPQNLVALDPKNLSSVITLNKKMMGPVPWRGGAFQLELGLFSVKGANLVGPVLDFLVDLSSTAGASFVGAVKPFVPFISKGMDMLAGQTDDVALEVGIDTTLPMTKEGTFAIVAKPKKGNIEPTALSLDPSDQKLLHNGAPLSAAYCVFSLKRVNKKADFGEIPELREAWGELDKAIKRQDQAEATNTFEAFRIRALLSPDLISRDAEALVDLAKRRMATAFPGGPTSAKSVGVLDQSGPMGWDELRQVPLYESS